MDLELVEIFVQTTDFKNLNLTLGLSTLPTLDCLLLGRLSVHTCVQSRGQLDMMKKSKTKSFYTVVIYSMHV